MRTPNKVTVGGRPEVIDNAVRALIDHPTELMNWLRLIVLSVATMLALSAEARADRLSLKHGLTEPFYSTTLNVYWAAPTNALPSAVIVFEVVPDSHREVTVSNLMAIGRFRPADRIKGFDPNMPFSKGAYGFRAGDGGRWLVYDPRQGRIDFDDESAFYGPGSNKNIEGVPDEATVLELALRLLPQLGISTNDMVKNESGGPRCVFPPGSWGHTDKDTQIYRRGIGFTRSLDGKEMDGQRAVFMEFGSNAKLGKLESRWCALRPKASYPVAPPKRILQWIKEGRAVVLSLSGPPDARYVRVADIRKLTITSIQPRYPYIDEDNHPKCVYPYGFLTATAELGEDDPEQVFLYCPLIAEGLPRAQRPAKADFPIYPATVPAGHPERPPPRKQPQPEPTGVMVRPRRHPREAARADERQRVRGHLEQYGAALSVTFCRAAGRTEYENQTASNGPPGWLHRQVDTMKIWSIKHKGHEIRVENGWFSGERLIVDGEIQDEHTGFAFRSRLWGKVRNGDGAGEAIKVSLGGWFGISCRIFVDDRLIPSGG